MSCDCISPPPEFDLPEPPDPSLIWELLADSGESLVHYQKARLQTCSYSPLLGFLDGNDFYLPALLCICFVALTVGCLVSACVYRRRRQERSKCLTSSVNTSKTNSGSSSDDHNTHWSPSYNSAINLAGMPSIDYSNSQQIFAQKVYGSSSSNNLFHAQPILANTKQGGLIRTLPKRTLPHQLSHVPNQGIQQNQSIRLHPQHFPSQYCIHNHSPLVENPMNYCTLSHQPQYEEIGSLCMGHTGTHYAANPICCESVNQLILQRHDSDTIFEDLSENIRCQELRRPPPMSKPPPVPSNFSTQRQYHQVQPLPSNQYQSRQSNSESSVTDELGSGSDIELEQLAQLGVPLPHDVLNVRQQSSNELLHGRESGYGTGTKTRLQLTNWHSPPQLLRIGSNVKSPLQSSSSGHSSQHNSPPSTAPVPQPRLYHNKHPNNNNQPDGNQQNMTYV